MQTAMKNTLYQRVASALNLDALSDSQRAVFLDKATEVICGRLILRVIDNLDAKSREEFERAIDDGGSALEIFLIKKVPNFADMVEEEILKLKMEIQNR